MGMDAEDWAGLLHLWGQVSAPKNCKVEIIEGVVTVAPPVLLSHHGAANAVQRPLHRVIPEDWGVYQTQAVVIPAVAGLFVPDILVTPEAILRRAGDAYTIPAAGAELVVEITSCGNARHDRRQKPRGYATAGVPLYLLIDAYAPGGPTVTLYGEPKDSVYRTLRAAPFGVKIHLPAPFDLTLDTAEFPSA
ncbi:Uma2 family endonuclease [Streptomyces sp. NPDC007818]|uniref:Uma2 family endonuclease n=1 Tax=Streptomyces sp. NPDC007818 TaxID=3364780 RepID=UPI0036CFDBC8